MFDLSDSRLADSVIGLFMRAEYQAVSEGWALEEAIRRTGDPTLLHRINFANLVGLPGNDERSELVSALWAHVCQYRLSATGSIKGASPKILEPEYLAGCQITNWHESVVKCQSNRAIQIQDVRIHPILRSPDAIHHLTGMGLADAFRRFVLEDPEVTKLNRQLPDPSLLERGVRPGPILLFHWPLNITADELASEYVRSVHFYSPSPPLLPAQEEISVVLVDRLIAFRDLLVGGHILARGTFVQRGEIVPIDPLQWRRSEIYIDASNGDLCSELNDRPVPIWTGVSFFRAPTSIAPRSPVETKPARQKLSAQYSSIRLAVEAIWPHGVPDSLTNGVRNQRIIDWQTNSQQTIVSDRTIRRYFAEFGKRHRPKSTR